jgi:pimeloyl-ACP methyl ester carboxylesterase
MEQFRHGDLVFDVRDSGPADGPVVILLHGFPQNASCWNAVTPRLTAQGYRCLAPDQRGYSAGARPRSRLDYRTSKLVADIAALIDASGADKVHLVGHDWGAAVAWGVAGAMPERLMTVTPVSVPHPTALLKTLPISRQGIASWYMYFFQLPWLPEFALCARNGAMAKKALVDVGLEPEAADHYVRAMLEPGAMRGGISWYRGLPLSNFARPKRGRITVPTMYVWSDNDVALLSKAAYATQRYVSAEYRFEVMHGVSHWIPEQRPNELSDLLLDWFGTHPIA